MNKILFGLLLCSLPVIATAQETFDALKNSETELRGTARFQSMAGAFGALGGSNPPDCGSFDGITGTGTPGGICKNCPFNQFGSGEGKSKACKNRRMLYLHHDQI